MEEGLLFPSPPQKYRGTPEFLQHRKVNFQVVDQRPGTLIYVAGGVPHQVLNTGIVLAEAVNVGGLKWNILQPVCQCSKAAVHPICRNRSSKEYVTSKPLTLHECPVDGCQATFPTAVHARAHAHQHAVGSAASSFACRLCSRVYIQEGALKTHLTEVHRVAGLLGPLRTCPSCGRSFGAAYRSHVRTCKGGPVTCTWFQVEFSSGRYKRHRLTCPSRPSTS